MQNNLKAAKIIIIALWLLAFSTAKAQQDSSRQSYSLEQILELAAQKSVAVQIAHTGSLEARQQSKVMRMSRQPVIQSSLSYGHISNANTWDPSFSKHATRDIPHISTQLNVEATAVLYKGGQVNQSIYASDTRAQVAGAAEEEAVINSQFTAMEAYLEIYRLTNEAVIIENNIGLARRRLENLQRMKQQGLVTPNEILRTSLTISELELQVKRTHNRMQAVNNELTALLGLSGNMSIIPDSSIWRQELMNTNADALLELAYQQSPTLQMAGLEKQLALTNINILKGERLPELSVYAFSNLQRPFMVSVPPTDIYFNVWQIGLRLRYNISSLYQSSKRIAAANFTYQQRDQQETLRRQQLSVQVKNALIRYRESQDELQVLENNRQLATENYRIVERKYNSQLALLTEVIDAANARIESEMRLMNGKIRIIYNYYFLIRQTGTFGAKY